MMGCCRDRHHSSHRVRDADGKITPAEGARFNVRMRRTAAGGAPTARSASTTRSWRRRSCGPTSMSSRRPTRDSRRWHRRSSAIMRGPLGDISKRPLLRPLIRRQISSR